MSNPRDDDDFDFVLDLTDLPELPPEQPETAVSAAESASPVVPPIERLEALLAPYGEVSIDKAATLLERKQVTEVKSEGQASWYNVAGSKLYVVKVTRGEDFLFVECSCPNGQHSGAEARCYHSIAARVLNAGLVETMIGDDDGTAS